MPHEDSGDWFKHFQDMTPDNVLPETGLRVVGYIGPSGDWRYSYEVYGDAPLSHAAGLMEMVKTRWLMSAIQEADDSDDADDD